MKMNESIRFEIFYGKKTLFDHNHEILLLFTSKNFTCEVLLSYSYLTVCHSPVNTILL